ncbi:hypothetical protein EYF80_050785 [Liparis tanakae]|uniref:Uncharacterized protein n=1 Tax=Liparis tanakae TaxID=230148 RepID=A0A4Z2FCS4_9TELE|nr:hypothetical protein EYF80_050785 [Liparis tanakae]
MAFSKVRSMTPFSRSSVSMVSSVTCFMSCWNFCGVSLLRMLRTRLNSSWVLALSEPLSSGSSAARLRTAFLADGFQAFSALFSWMSSPSDIVVTNLRLEINPDNHVELNVKTYRASAATASSSSTSSSSSSTTASSTSSTASSSTSSSASHSRPAEVGVGGREVGAAGHRL